MHNSRAATLVSIAAGSCVLAWLVLGPWPAASAQGTFPDPDANCPPSECGQVSPFIPLQSAEAVHMGLVWKKDSQTPKISYGRPFDIRIAGRAAGDLRVITPTHQAQAVPGVYMLFVADERGVPSAGHRVDLKP